MVCHLLPFAKVGRPLARGVSGCLLDTLLLILDTLISIFFVYNATDEMELDTQFTPNVYFWTPYFEILANALKVGQNSLQM